MNESLSKQHQFWYEHICTADKSGLSYSAYAKQHNLDLKTLYNRKTLFRNKGLLHTAPSQQSKSNDKFIELKPTAKMPSGNASVQITLSNGVCLQASVSDQQVTGLINELSRI